MVGLVKLARALSTPMKRLTLGGRPSASEPNPVPDSRAPVEKMDADAEAWGKSLLGNAGAGLHRRANRPQGLY